MSLEQIIARLVGPSEAGQAGVRPLSAEESRALSQQLRAIVDGETSADTAQRADDGPAADALKLAAYLDGSMTVPERDAFEAELVRSQARRDEVVAAAAWIEEIAAKHEMPPASATALATALETPAAAQSAKPAGGFTAWIEWLLPRPRLAVATSALASFAILAVGVDIALHTNPQFRAAIQSTATPGDAPDTWKQPPDRTFLPSLPGDPLILNAETINALIAYRNDPSQARQTELLAALTRAGARIAHDRVRSIALQPQLIERLSQRGGTLPTRISTRLSINGELAITMTN
jgi:hypothetical protein